MATNAKPTKPSTAATRTAKPAAAETVPVAVRKAVADAGYIAIGLGVLGVQHAQTRRHQLNQQIRSATGDVRSFAKAQSDKLSAIPTKISSIDLSADVKARLDGARQRATEIGETTRVRVAPVVDQLELRVSELPKPLPQAAAPVVRAAKQVVAVAS
jgi:hypothetical protein